MWPTVDIDQLQADIDNFVEWSNTWLLVFHPTVTLLMVNLFVMLPNINSKQK